MMTKRRKVMNATKKVLRAFLSSDWFLICFLRNRSGKMRRKVLKNFLEEYFLDERVIFGSPNHE